MAIRLSSWLWLRNNELRYLTEERNKRHYQWPGVSDTDMKTLREVIEEVDKVHSESDFDTPSQKRIVGPHVDVAVTAEYVEVSRNPEQSAKLFQRIHEVLRKYRVSPDIYRRLGEAHKEISAKPATEDFAKAIEYMGAMYEKQSRALELHDYSIDSGGKFCWESLIRKGYPSTASC